MATELHQNDPRWKNQVLGFGTNETINDFGCLLTSITMVINYHGGNETPLTLNAKMKQRGGFINAWVRPAAVPSVFSNVKDFKRVECSDRAAPLGQIDTALAAGNPVIVMVDYSPQPGIQGHWVVLHKKVGDDYEIWDPYPGTEKTLKGRYSHAGESAGQIIQDIIWYTRTGATPPAAKSGDGGEARQPVPTPPPDTSVTLQPTTDGLKMRSQPQVVAGNIVKALMRSARLTPLETNASAKIGQMHQWIHVRDKAGAEGYVAAWYVTAVDDPALGVHKKQKTVEALKVKPTQDDVAFRSQPTVTGNTLIRRVPASAVFTVIEGGDPAQKIGVFNAWLNVRASDGTEGYLAAWYVLKA